MRFTLFAVLLLAATLPAQNNNGGGVLPGGIRTADTGSVGTIPAQIAEFVFTVFDSRTSGSTVTDGWIVYLGNPDGSGVLPDSATAWFTLPGGAAVFVSNGDGVPIVPEGPGADEWGTARTQWQSGPDGRLTLTLATKSVGDWDDWWGTLDVHAEMLATMYEEFPPGGWISGGADSPGAPVGANGGINIGITSSQSVQVTTWTDTNGATQYTITRRKTGEAIATWVERHQEHTNAMMQAFPPAETEQTGCIVPFPLHRRLVA